jgi:hypothetical protein
LLAAVCVQLQLSWLKWVLPAGVFRRGFDQQQQQQQQRQQQGGSSLRTPLLSSQQDEMQDLWHEAVNTLQHNGGDVKVRQIDSHSYQPVSACDSHEPFCFMHCIS